MKKSTVFIIITLVVVCAAQLLVVLNDKKTTDTTQEPAGSVTLANFHKITLGMAKAEVFKIMGKGVEAARGGQGDIVISSYSWTSGIFGANCSVTFQNDKVINKAQAGLK